jgi:uncharacterized damage-inducible protein DinB
MPDQRSRIAVEHYLYILDKAFDSEFEHALVKNLSTVRDEDWTVLPPNAKRSIAQIAQHVGDCKFMYANKAFGDGAMTWGDFDERWRNLPSRDSMIEWLRDGHAFFRSWVEKLDDAELLVLRTAPWDEQFETRWLISAIIEHDLYHAGEINHIRALLQNNDAWEFASE